MAFRSAFPKRALAASAIAAAFAVACPAAAQNDGSRAVVQPLPPPEASQLSAALQTLASSPRDLDALIAAGNASFKLDDIDAALGFFARADEVSPGNAQAKAGIAAALVRQENPFDALRLFDQAEQAGASLTEMAGERALAYDLVGDNARAQQIYRSILARGDDPQAARRLAVSLAITGDEAGMERVLLPMLQRNDLAAFRARAFSLAILGKVDEAMTIADAVMPAALAAKVAPYLRYMPRLTRAQQAAAANLGNFPRTEDIGRDDPRVAEYEGASPATAPRTVTRGADARLVPSGAPLGPTEKRASRPDGELPPVGSDRAVAAATPKPAAAQPPARPAVSVARREESPAPTPTPAPAPTPAARPAPTPQPGFDLASTAGSRRAAPSEPAPPQPAAVAPSAAAPARSEPSATPPEPASGARPSDVAEAFSDFQLALSPNRPAPGAVDIAKIDPPREKPPAPKEEAKPAPPKNPSRHWVQLATGRDRKALGFDWRRLTREAKALLKGHDGYLAHWNSTNRLLTGPFDSEKAAQDFVTELKKAGVDSFTFTSDTGEEIAPLP